jgi:hypothetical protein
LRQQDDTIISNHISFDVETFKRVVLRDTFGNPFASLHLELIEFKGQLLDIV